MRGFGVSTNHKGIVMSKDTELAAEATAEGKGNLKLWRSVEKTPPAMTKLVSFGKRKWTNIDPQWQLQKATDKWGPYGHRWGMRNIKYQIVEVKSNDKVALETKNEKGDVVQSTEILADFIKYSIILEAEFFYPLDGKEVAFQIINDDKYSVDDDVLKKIITNTRSKALSWLGFSADVFLGKFDDTKYVEDLKKRFSKQDAFMAQVAAKVWEAKDLDTLAQYEEKLNDVAVDQAKDLDASAIEELRNLIEERKQALKGKDE